MSNLNEVLSNMTEFLKSEAKTETIIGQQFALGEFICVPVMSVGFGVGGGGGEGKGIAGKNGVGEGTGAGAGMGMGMAPMGFLVTKGEEIQFIATRTSKGLGATFEKIPDIVEKFLEKNKRKETEKA